MEIVHSSTSLFFDITTAFYLSEDPVEVVLLYPFLYFYFTLSITTTFTSSCSSLGRTSVNTVSPSQHRFFYIISSNIYSWLSAHYSPLHILIASPGFQYIFLYYCSEIFLVKFNCLQHFKMLHFIKRFWWMIHLYNTSRRFYIYIEFHDNARLVYTTLCAPVISINP